jgi:hypothetical protein
MTFLTLPVGPATTCAARRTPPSRWWSTPTSRASTAGGCIRCCTRCWRGGLRSDWYTYFPLVQEHPHAYSVAVALEAAGQRGRFWELHDRLLSEPVRLGRRALAEQASELGLNPDAVQRPSSEQHDPKVREDFRSGSTAACRADRACASRAPPAAHADAGPAARRGRPCGGAVSTAADPAAGLRPQPQGVTAAARQYLHTRAGGAVLLLLATVLALVWSNSPWSGSYVRFPGDAAVLAAGRLRPDRVAAALGERPVDGAVLPARRAGDRARAVHRRVPRPPGGHRARPGGTGRAGAAGDAVLRRGRHQRRGRARLEQRHLHRHRLHVRRARAGRTTLPEPAAAVPAGAGHHRRHRRHRRDRRLLPDDLQLLPLVLAGCCWSPSQQPAASACRTPRRTWSWPSRSGWPPTPPERTLPGARSVLVARMRQQRWPVQRAASRSGS